jgi:hypothetical protein
MTKRIVNVPVGTSGHTATNYQLRHQKNFNSYNSYSGNDSSISYRDDSTVLATGMTLPATRMTLPATQATLPATKTTLQLLG